MSENSEKNLAKAYLYSKTVPDDAHKERFLEFLRNRYHEEFDLLWVERPKMSGFRLIVGNEIYDWTRKGRVQQLKDMFQTRVMDAVEKE